MKASTSTAAADEEALAALIYRCARDDAGALKALFERTSPQLFGLLIRILGRDDLAQEALQDVYVSVWTNADRYNRRKGAPFTWLVSIARYRAIDIKRSRRHEVSMGYLPDVEATTGETREVAEDPLASAAHDADVALLNECLARLELSQRSAVSMAYLRGLTHSEIAAQIQAPIGTVKSWIRRGLASLRECLQR